MNDKLTDWYKAAQGSGLTKQTKRDKNYKNHLILPCSMIVIIGATGQGKSTALVEFITKEFGISQNYSFFRFYG